MILRYLSFWVQNSSEIFQFFRNIYRPFKLWNTSRWCRPTAWVTGIAETCHQHWRVESQHLANRKSFPGSASFSYGNFHECNQVTVWVKMASIHETHYSHRKFQLATISYHFTQLNCHSVLGTVWIIERQRQKKNWRSWPKGPAHKIIFMDCGWISNMRTKF